jgi:hypothetical protein
MLADTSQAIEIQSYHLVAPSNENRDCSGIGAFLNYQHLLSRRAKAHLSYDSSLS